MDQTTHRLIKTSFDTCTDLVGDDASSVDRPGTQAALIGLDLAFDTAVDGGYRIGEVLDAISTASHTERE